MRIYNTLSHQIEEFKPLVEPQVSMYACGPTVYDFSHIGHMRRYVGDDILVRVLKADGYKIKHTMNITDVGHLTSDSDTGEDKMEKGAKKLGKSVWDIAKEFETQFFDSEKLLNIVRPDPVMHATDFIKEQIALVQILDKKDFVYIIENDGVYFDTAKFPDYFKLSRQNPKELKVGARVDYVEGKRNIADFALWKFSPKNDPSINSGLRKRQMEWESPWGVGFPGWHIECSAMSMKALGDTLDIHTGGIDHINIHHTNEIAQSEAATGKKFVNYWIHHAFLQVEGEKMSKSLNNFYTVQDIVKKGYDPLALRYLYLQTHYRQEMNFTFEALEAAQNALERLHSNVALSMKPEGEPVKEFEDQFIAAINDDLNMPKALSIVWILLHSEDYSSWQKSATLLKFDEVLGLGLREHRLSMSISKPMTSEIQKMLEERENLRKEKKFAESDKMREKIIEMGYEVEDKS
jgi:cysteinyl-tRNA synthetase